MFDSWEVSQLEMGSHAMVEMAPFYAGYHTMLTLVPLLTMSLYKADE